MVNAASFRGGAVAPGEIVTIFGSGFGPATLAAAQYADGQLPTSVGETRVLFDGMAAPMIYSSAGQVSAIVPYSVSGTCAGAGRIPGHRDGAGRGAGGRSGAGHLHLPQ